MTTGGFYWRGAGTQGPHPGRGMANPTRSPMPLGGTNKGGAAHAQRHGLIYVTTNFGKVAGRWVLPGTEHGVSANRITAEAMAQRLAECMAEAITPILRPGVSTGRLKATVLDPRNRVARAKAFGVGRLGWLNNESPARAYWRAIEEGTSYFVGRRIHGVWGSTIGGYLPGGRYGPYPRAERPYVGFGMGTGQRLRPMFTPAVAYSLLRGRGPRQDVGGISGVIEKPIIAKHFMRTGWKNFDARTEGRAFAQMIIKDYLARKP